VKIYQTFQIEVFWTVKPRSVVFLSSMLHSPRSWIQYGPPKSWYPITTLHGVTTQKTSS